MSAGLRHARVGLLVLGLVAGTAGSAGLALGWRALLALADGRWWPRRTVLRWYFAGELGKYLPGSVWSVLGRGELARRAGVSRRDAYTATLLGLALMCVGAAVLCGLLVPFEGLGAHTGDGGRGIGVEAITVAAIPAAALLCLPRVNGAIFGLVRRMLRGRVDLAPQPARVMAGLIGRYLPAWALTAALSVSITAALGYRQQIAQVALAALAAWVIGFLAVPVPAGAGVREVVFVALCGLPAGPAVAVAALARVALIVSDGACGAIALAGLGLRRAGTVVTDTASTDSDTAVTDRSADRSG